MSEVIYDVAIVGGGLAGMNAAIRCEELGLRSVILEASDQLGGKLRTDRDEEGFLYDRGFQVCFTAYDEIPNGARNFFARDSEWMLFSPGATIAGLGTLSKWNFVRSLGCRALSPFDLIKLLLLNQKSGNWESYRSTQNVADFLEDFGFSSKAIQKFFAPFYGGISLDRGLRGSSKQFLKTWFYLSKGKTATLRGGIVELPMAMSFAYGLRDTKRGPTVMTESRVTGFTKGEEYYSLVTTEPLKARSLILAGGPKSGESLLNRDFEVDFKQSTCLYFASGKPVTREKYIVLNPASNALVNQLVPLSNVNRACAPKGKHLCSATIIGDRPESDEELAQMAIDEMNTWGINLPPLEFKRAYRIKEAQLCQEPGFEDRVPSIKTHLPGVFLAGEITTSSSINDALKSGRLAAEAALAYLRNK
jgi:protoporphyrinogen oxidase